jgi:hypothetical protein
MLEMRCKVLPFIAFVIKTITNAMITGPGTTGDTGVRVSTDMAKK